MIVRAQEVVDSNVLPFCDLKPKTLGEKENEFLMALQAFYETGASPATSSIAAGAARCGRAALRCASLREWVFRQADHERRGV